jgi:putative oxidoreductase
MLQQFNTMASRLERPAYAALRIISGAAFSFHGMQKIFGWLADPGHVPPVGSQMWIGGLIELVTGILIAIGLLTRPAAFLASGTMAVAYIQFHWQFQFGDWKWLPAINQGELALIYCFLFLFIFAHGAGAASIDGMRRR